MYDIIEVDIRPLKLNIICGDNITLKFKKTFEIQPVFNQDIQEFEINIEDLNILATGKLREEAIEYLKSDIIWLWQEYSNIEEEFAEDAIELSNHLRDLLVEVR